MLNAIKIHTILLFTALPYFLTGQNIKYSNEFLQIGVGARALSMGKATIASVEDVSAAYWNPATLARMPHEVSVGAMHSEYFSGIAKYDYLAGAYQYEENKTLALSVIRFGIDDIQNTLQLKDINGDIDYSRITKFSVADYAFLASYAQQTNIPGLYLGGNAKLIRRIIGSFASSWGLGFDVAAQYHYKNWRFAAVGKDITSTFNAWSFNEDELSETFLRTGNEMPTNSLEITRPQLAMGVARDFKINEKYSGMAEVNANFSFDGKRNELIGTRYGNIDPVMGVEINYIKIVYLRFGMGNIQKTSFFDDSSITLQPNIGIGINVFDLKIDYALTNFSQTSVAPYSHIFSLIYSFNTRSSM